MTMRHRPETDQTVASDAISDGLLPHPYRPEILGMCRTCGLPSQHSIHFASPAGSPVSPLNLMENETVTENQSQRPCGSCNYSPKCSTYCVLTSDLLNFPDRSAEVDLLSTRLAEAAADRVMLTDEILRLRKIVLEWAPDGSLSSAEAASVSQPAEPDGPTHIILQIDGKTLATALIPYTREMVVRARRRAAGPQ